MKRRKLAVWANSNPKATYPNNLLHPRDQAKPTCSNYPPRRKMETHWPLYCSTSNPIDPKRRKGTKWKYEHFGQTNAIL